MNPVKQVLKLQSLIYQLNNDTAGLAENMLLKLCLQVQDELY